MNTRIYNMNNIITKMIIRKPIISNQIKKINHLNFVIKIILMFFSMINKKNM